jgi:glucose/arabinose dehydrogenase
MARGFTESSADGKWEIGILSPDLIAGSNVEDFLTGFVLPDGKVWGRPVGVTVAPDGSPLVSDDGSNSVWRVSYTGK